MAAHAARRLERMNRNLSLILGVELICAAQGVEFRQPLSTSESLQRVLAQVRQIIPAIGQDRYFAPDLEAASQLIAEGKLVESVDLPEYVKGGQA